MQQSIEKILKSFSAYENQPIKKTHNLIELYELSAVQLDLSDEEVLLLGIATNYYTKQRYPIPHKKLPTNDEISKVLNLTKELLEKSCQIFNIDLDEIKSIL